MTSIVSIIIPTYNYAHYIQRAIDSALAQTYANIEILVVDDGSTDNTLAILAQYGDRIRVFHQPNQGASVARNLGISKAEGEYIAFLDADDAYLPENIAKKTAYLSENSEYQWCYSNCVWKDSHGIVLQQGDAMPQTLIAQKAEGEVLDQAIAGALLGSNLFLFHRDVLHAIGGFDEKLKVLEDYALYVFAAARFPIGYVDEVLVEIHAHTGSLSQSGKWRGYISRWYLNQRIQRHFADAIVRVEKPWRLIQADVYRNLAELSFAKGHQQRALVLLKKSLAYHCWQPGAFRLWLRLR